LLDILAEFANIASMSSDAIVLSETSLLNEARAEVFRALAHPARLQMLEALADRELCVCELQALVGSSLPTVSRHLAQMRAAGLLSCRREGTNVYYRLLTPCLLNTLACIDQALRADSERRAQLCAVCHREGEAA
jgi:DNA-binding transcriptional ArsR family regulator